MSHEFFGVLSGTLVALSVIPYLWSTIRGTITPQLSSWGLWTLIGFAILITYHSSSQGGSMVPVIFGFVNPLAVTLVTAAKTLTTPRKKVSLRNLLRRVTISQWACVVLGILSLCLWLVVHNDPKQARFALYTAIAADMCAVVPTLLFVLRSSEEEKPFPWLFFSLGYAFAIPAVREPGFDNYVLPLYMTFGTFVISIPIVIHYMRARKPILAWIF